MRPPIKNNKARIVSAGFRHDLPLSFTGDAINQLALSGYGLFDIKDWVWHTEIVNGVQYCIVTERLSIAPSPGGEPQ
ncbi:hypothetical protein [Niabella drilacis]|uniref:Uncharacterized protein n=1 Tax=Niabella drilacis (strain DSM 25811 / CCM 8410 / CCUG 62505 / LMG 26954 / E90) TaxID=1285928 RepID=A0A1G6TQV4_NIADE|nr:hypothetical protein [Niabella drilacis]SDD31542.1 hypothetical protein SAMN04487894_1081 [Niabella drilacis]